MLQPRIPLSLALAPQVQGHYPYFWRGTFLNWLQTGFVGLRRCSQTHCPFPCFCVLLFSHVYLCPDFSYLGQILYI